MARQIFPLPEPFLAADAGLAARLFNQTGRRLRSLADCMIAAVAIRCGARLATNNVADNQPKRLLWGLPMLPYFEEHQGMHALAFGPEGDLYFSCGDNLSGTR